MGKTFDQGKDDVARLCNYFQVNQDEFHARNEAQVRQQLINPLFEALGWDVGNAGQVAPQYAEVVTEQSQDDEGPRKSPDYTFRVGTLPKFYVEAKRSSIDLSTDPAPAFQLRRYGWTKGLSPSLLTNFKAFGVYDCTIRPHQSDKASRSRISLYHFHEYVDRWRELWDIFSREAVWSGAFDRYAASKRKRGTSEVDVEFLKEIEGWRDVLARNIALRNKDLSSGDLNAAVQRTIDRIIFLRMAEDRGLELDEQLLKLCERDGVYPRFMRDLCRKADEKYNSGLFHFQKESDVSEDPDRVTPKLTVDDKVFKPILQSLYFAHGSPYHFGILPVEILGTVYERFLGKVIRLTAGHQAKVEEKPEVRKAGGVYYTPDYIVAYIVNHTVAPMIEGRTPSQLAHGKDKSPFRVLDMACGSGSFLLGAYQHLLDYCLRWYFEHKPETFKKAVYEDPRDGHWRLTIAEKKRILTAHVFGVDIDPQAVEVTKLSLLLKVLEGETSQSVSQQQRLFHDRALPNLAANIKCGNSLIGSDYYSGKLNFEIEEIDRVKAFDWKQGFPDAMMAGGFDCVIGNPPYGFHQIHNEMVKPYFRSHYFASAGSFEHYFLFYERSLGLLRKGGMHGFIVPVTWLTIPSAKSLRQFVLNSYALRRVVWLPELVFKNAQVNTLVSIIGKLPAGDTIVEIHEKLGFVDPPAQTRRYEQTRFVDADYYIGIVEQGQETAIIEKVCDCSQPLGTIARPCSGYNPYEVGKGERPGGGSQTKETVETKPYHSETKRGREWRPEIVGRDLQRYAVNVSGRRWIKYGPWLAAPRDPENFRGRRILVQEITGGASRRIIAAFCDQELYHSRDVIPVKLNETPFHPWYLLGILNSRLMSWFHQRRNPKALKQLFPKVLVSDQNAHDRIVKVVDSMLELQKHLVAAKSEAQRATIQQQINATDAEIDRLVYELYGLTAEDITIIEGSQNLVGKT
jgi:hypothetical protein